MTSFWKTHSPCWRLVPALTVTLALLLSACADDGDGPTTAPAPDPTATAATAASPTPPPVTPTAADPSPTGPAATEAAPAASATATTAAPTPTPDEPPVFDPAAVTLDIEPVAEGFTRPLFATHAGDGSGRVFIVEQEGTIRLLSGEMLLDISERVGSQGNEQGLLGLAFHPRFADNGYLYVNYTDTNGDTVISRFTMTPDGVIDPGSEYVILTQEQPASNHNGGMLAFGPDGYLYIGMGDGGRAYDAFGTAQDVGSLLGKILRIDVDGGEPYGIPPDNPFVGTDGARPEVWAYGLRNPWRFSFDRLTDDLYIGDVGQNMYEWVHFQPAGSPGGENYGWPIFEGDHCLIEERCDEEGFVPPIAVYDHGSGCAIIGGHVYRGAQFPALQGAYLFADLCSGNIWTTARDATGAWQTALMLQIDAQISSLGEDESGEMYVTDLAGGRVFRLVAG